MTQILDDLLARLADMSPQERAALEKEALEATKSMEWIPSPGPQTDAYFSKADVLLYGGEPGGGKDLDINTLLPTPHGFSRMGDIQVGDEVFDENGLPCNIIAKSETFNHQCYELTFSDGSSIVAGKDHQWVTSTRAERQRALKCTDEWRTKRRETREKRGTGKRPDLAIRNTQTASSQDLPLQGIRTTQEIYNSLRAGSDNRINHAVTIAKPLHLPEAELLIDPYTLGAWLGDGSSGAGAICGIDEEIFENVAVNYDMRRRLNITHTFTGLRKHLRLLGLLNNKHIPSVYLRASFEQRIALLQGIMDTDGHANDRGQCELCMTRKGLMNDIHELITTLGIKSTITESIASLNGRITGPKYTIKFLTDLPAFRLSRKLIRQKRNGFRGTHDVRYIVDVKEVASVPTQCIQVDSPNHMYLCGREMIPTHNSSLLLGLALTSHRRSLIMRRQYTDLSHLIEETLKFNSGKKGFSGAPPPKLRRENGQLVDFGAAKNVGDEQHWQGNPHDFIGIDEATQFAESQIRFLMGWLRSAEDPNQRKRVVLATNPPLMAEGLWVIQMFAPWLDETYPDPALPGELRWVITDENGEDEWVDGPEIVIRGEKELEPISRSYIPASVKDNPYLADSGYQKQLDAMPEPMRSIMMGGFKQSFTDQDKQVIPTKWVREAQARWQPNPPEDIPMCSMGVDCSGGGKDPMVIAPRHDGWFAPLIKVPGKDLPMDALGRTQAAQVVMARRDRALVIVDMGGGYGGSIYEHLDQNDIDLQAYKGSEATTRKTNDGKLRFYNTRSAAYWAFREALDPGQPGGSRISLPDSPILVADLTAPIFEVTVNGIKVEAKEKVKDRLKRSTDEGDAVIMAWFYGERETTSALAWLDARESKKRHMTPKVVMGRNRR